MIFTGAVNVALGCLAIFAFVTGREMDGPGERVGFGLLGALFLWAGLYVSALTLKTKVILYPDRIEHYAVKTVRSLRREEIMGWHVVWMKYFSTLVLKPQKREMKQLRIILMLKRDQAFDYWLTTLPRLDQVERAESAARILEDQSVGATAEERAQLLAGARTKAKVLSWIAGVAAVEGFFYPRPYEVTMAILGVLPLAAMALLATGGGLYQLRGRPNDARADLSIAIFLPSLAMGLRGALDLNLLEWMPLIAAMVAGTVVLTILVVAVSRGMSERPWAILPLMLLYLFGAMTQANTLLDHSKSQVFPVRVLNKRISTTNSTFHYFQVESWGPRRSVNEVNVSSSVYDAVFVGQNACVHVWPGALRAPWYVVRTCK